MAFQNTLDRTLEPRTLSLTHYISKNSIGLASTLVWEPGDGVQLRAKGSRTVAHLVAPQLDLKRKASVLSKHALLLEASFVYLRLRFAREGQRRLLHAQHVTAHPLEPRCQGLRFFFLN